MEHQKSACQHTERARGGATVVAVLIILSIVCMLAHQTARTLVLLRQGQDYSMRIAQANEVLELGHELERRFQDDPEQLRAGPIILALGQEYAKLEFASEPPQTAAQVELAEKAEQAIDTKSTDRAKEDADEPALVDDGSQVPRKSVVRITATWPVDSQGAELDNRVPIVVSWEKFLE